MYVLISKNILKNYRVNTKTIKSKAIIISDLPTLLVLPRGSSLTVFFEHSISLSHLLDIQAALGLEVTMVVNNRNDYNLCSTIFPSKLLAWDFIDGDLIQSIIVNDEKQMELYSTATIDRQGLTNIENVLHEAERILASPTANEANKLVAQSLINLNDVLKKVKTNDLLKDQELATLRKTNIGLEAATLSMSADMEDFLKTYAKLYTQLSARNIVDVIKDSRTFAMPSNTTSLVIKNFGLPHLMRLVNAIKDSLITAHDRYTKVIYIAEADSVSIQEIDRSKFLLMSGEVSASDLLKNDYLLCVGNTKEPLEFLTSVSTTDVYIIVDSRRNTNELITGYTLQLFGASDSEVAANMGLDSAVTITGSEKSTYTIRESDFVGKKRHAVRNSELVVSITNSLLGG